MIHLLYSLVIVALSYSHLSLYIHTILHYTTYNHPLYNSIENDVP